MITVQQQTPLAKAFYVVDDSIFLEFQGVLEHSSFESLNHFVNIAALIDELKLLRWILFCSNLSCTPKKFGVEYIWRYKSL